MSSIDDDSFSCFMHESKEDLDRQLQWLLDMKENFDGLSDILHSNVEGLKEMEPNRMGDQLEALFEISTDYIDWLALAATVAMCDCNDTRAKEIAELHFGSRRKLADISNDTYTVLLNRFQEMYQNFSPSMETSPQVSEILQLDISPIHKDLENFRVSINRFGDFIYDITGVKPMIS
ncbi:hypothetical protein TWF281_002137 [Arthrobotrys megalospora]